MNHYFLGFSELVDAVKTSKVSGVGNNIIFKLIMARLTTHKPYGVSHVAFNKGKVINFD